MTQKKMENKLELACKTYIEERESQKTKRPYSVLVSDFGSYKIENFLKEEQIFILRNLEKFNDKK